MYETGWIEREAGNEDGQYYTFELVIHILRRKLRPN